MEILKELLTKLRQKLKEFKPLHYPVEPIGDAGKPGPVYHEDPIPVDPPVPKPIATQSTGKKKK